MFKVHTYSAYLPEQYADELPLCQQWMQLDLQGPVEEAVGSGLGPGAGAGEVCGAHKTAWNHCSLKGGGQAGPSGSGSGSGSAHYAQQEHITPSRSSSGLAGASDLIDTHLKNIGLDSATGQEGLHLRQAEVADADGPHQPGVNQRLHGRPTGRGREGPNVVYWP